MRRGDDHLGIQLSQPLCLVLFSSLQVITSSLRHLGTPLAMALGSCILALWHLGTPLAIALGSCNLALGFGTWHRIELYRTLEQSSLGTSLIRKGTT